MLSSEIGTQVGSSMDPEADTFKVTSQISTFAEFLWHVKKAITKREGYSKCGFL
jgi:hypothetical protein